MENLSLKSVQYWDTCAGAWKNIHNLRELRDWMCGSFCTRWLLLRDKNHAFFRLCQIAYTPDSTSFEGVLADGRKAKIFYEREPWDGAKLVVD